MQLSCEVLNPSWHNSTQLNNDKGRGLDNNLRVLYHSLYSTSQQDAGLQTLGYGTNIIEWFELEENSQII